MAIGSAETLSPEQAREAARQKLARVDLGQDPADDRRERRDKDKLSFRSVVAEYIEVKRDDVRPNTFRYITGYLVRGPHFKPLWGMPLDRITRKDVAAQLVTIARQNGRPTARQARGALNAFFSWAMTMGLVEGNPVIGTAQPRGNPARTRILSDTELAAIWNAADGSDDFAKIFRLLILLPCRRAEVGGMSWSELDLDAATWTVPAARAKNGQGHHVAADAYGARHHQVSPAPRRARSFVWPASRTRVFLVGPGQESARCEARYSGVGRPRFAPNMRHAAERSRHGATCD